MDKTVNTFELVCEKLGKDPKAYTVRPEWDAHEKYSMGIKRILLIHQFWQGGKKIDFAKRSQEKWFPCFWPILDDNGRLSGFRFFDSYCTDSFTYSVLCPLLRFHEEKISTFVGETFLDEFNTVLMLENEL